MPLPAEHATILEATPHGMHAIPPEAAPTGSGRNVRVLLFTYHFPPDGSVGGLRWASFAPHMRRAGMDVRIITAAPGASTPGQVHTVRRGRTLNDVYRSVAAKLRGPGTDAGVRGRAAAEPTAAPGGIAGLRRELAGLLSFPDHGRGWLLRAAWNGRRLMREFEPDVVVSSGPPHTAHLAAALATLGSRTPHIVDMRDPWWECRSTHVDANTALERIAVPRMEDFVLRRAAQVLTNARGFRDALAQRRPHLDVSCVPNGFDEDRIPRLAQESFPGLSLCYMGTLYFGRDFGPVLTALSRFFARNPAASGDGSMLRIAGHMADDHRDRFTAQLAASGLEGRVELMGLLPPADALGMLQRSRLSIVLAQDQGMQVPGKLYESVGLGVPTLVVTESDSASAREAARVGAYVVEPDDVDGARALMERLWTGELPPRQAARVAIDVRTLAVDVSALVRQCAADAHVRTG